MTEILYFYPWLRRGLGLGIADLEQDRLSNVPLGAEITASIELEGETTPISHTMLLKGPDHAKSISQDQIARRYPEAGTGDAEYGYFPHIEFTAPDLPWVLSPKSANETSSLNNSDSRLRPWIGLICVEASRATLTPQTQKSPQRLTVFTGDLPDITESWAWAHTQSAIEAADIQSAVDSASSVVLSRLVCPRKLQAGKQYRAAVVNLWRRTETELVPAWTDDPADVELDVFTTWTFSTGNIGSFEELCERLKPVPEGTLSLGAYDMDLKKLGLLDTFKNEEKKIVDYTGALLDAGVKPEQLEGNHKDKYDEDIREHFQGGTERPIIAPDDPDPVVTAPIYGSYAVGHRDIPKSGWYYDLNIPPRRRAAAGLGAKVVRKNQERYMAHAWDQVGPVREVNRMLNLGRLQAEVGRTWKDRTSMLDAVQSITVLKPQATFTRDEKGTPTKLKIKKSNMPAGLLSPAFQRAIRPSGVIAKTLNSGQYFLRGQGEEVQVHERQDWTQSLNDKLNTQSIRTKLAIGAIAEPVGITFDKQDANPESIPQKYDLNLKDEQQTILESVQLVSTVRARMEARIPALANFMVDNDPKDMLTEIRVEPKINQPLVWEIMEMSAELLSPGVKDFPDNSARLLEADPAYAAAVLAGANHEFTRELLWREFPAPLNGTCFSRFWDRPNLTDVDIPPMESWQHHMNKTLDDVGAAGGETAVLLIRGDLIRQYQGVRIMLLAPGKTTPQEPSFVGKLPPDTRFLGFDVASVDDLVKPATPADEYKIIIEEPPGEPRFGLDEVTDYNAHTLPTYNDLSWSLLENQKTDHLVIALETTIPRNAQLATEAEWGKNSAHMALATYQKPYRRVFNATDLLGGG